VRDRIEARMSSLYSLVAIGLGSNEGDREQHLQTAIDSLQQLLTQIRVGGLYESAPLGANDQPRYLNSAVVGRTRLEPEPLLAVLKFLEYRAGRRQGKRWGPRPLDLDLLTYGELTRDRPELTLPHPELRRRAFVLTPLADAAPELEIPPERATAAELLARLPDDGSQRALSWKLSS